MCTQLITVRPGQAIEFHADSNIVMRNLNFFIHPTASLTFVTEGAISIGKDQVSISTLCFVKSITLSSRGRMFILVVHVSYEAPLRNISWDHVSLSVNLPDVCLIFFSQ